MRPLYHGRDIMMPKALSLEFGEKFWKFIDEGGYENCNTTSGKPQFFRFTEPKDPSYPKMIELFARTEFPLREPNVLTPIHIDDDIASLSGILLNEDYYSVLLKGRTVIDGLSVLKPEYLILFKAKAYMDLKAKRDAGEEVHSSEFKKHKKDVQDPLSVMLSIRDEMDDERVEESINEMLKENVW